MTTAVRNIEQKNVFFEPMQVLNKLITENVTDINSIRTNRTNAKDRQWVFPTTPEANDEDYPRIALIPEQIKFDESGAGRWLQRDSKPDGSAIRDKYGRIATVPITIGIFCKKDQKHKATYFDGTIHTVQNSKQSDFIGYLVANKLEQFKNKYFIPLNMELIVKEISTTYEDNDFTWAKDITCEVLIYDVWTEDYSEADLIKSINLSMSTI